MNTGFLNIRFHFSVVTEKEASTGDVKQGLEKSAKFFRESLGLQFKKVSGEENYFRCFTSTRTITILGM